jgi:two-component system, OmpR family, response regulator
MLVKDKPILKKIMMVEDDVDIQTIARLALETIGDFDVLTCDSGYDAIDNVERFKPDLILLDVMMPEMDGITTFKKLREIKSAKIIPIIFMSAKVQHHEVEEYYHLGAMSVIAKPFDPMALADNIKVCWEKKHG